MRGFKSHYVQIFIRFLKSIFLPRFLGVEYFKIIKDMSDIWVLILFREMIIFKIQVYVVLRHTKCDCQIYWLWVCFPLEEINYLNLYFHFFAPELRQSSASSSDIQHTMTSEFSGKWAMECLNTKAPLNMFNFFPFSRTEVENRMICDLVLSIFFLKHYSKP